MTQTTLGDDLAYVRDLAEAGQVAPLLGGRFLAWWGGMATLAYAGHYAIAAGIVDFGPAAYAWLWTAFGIIGTGGYFLLVKTMSGAKPGAASAGNKAEANVWMAGGMVLFAYFITLTVKSFATGQADAGFMNSLPLVFAVYAVGLLTSGAMATNTTLRNAGFVAMAMVAISTWFTGTNHVWLIASIGVFLTVFIPGILLMRQEPSDIV